MAPAGSVLRAASTFAHRHSSLVPPAGEPLRRPSGLVLEVVYRSAEVLVPAGKIGPPPTGSPFRLRLALVVAVASCCAACVNTVMAMQRWDFTGHPVGDARYFQLVSDHATTARALTWFCGASLAVLMCLSITNRKALGYWFFYPCVGAALLAHLWAVCELGYYALGVGV
jgi:hypothetical protein